MNSREMDYCYDIAHSAFGNGIRPLVEFDLPKHVDRAAQAVAVLASERLSTLSAP